MFEGLVEDSMDETLTYQFMNLAKGRVESAVDWEILKKLDQTLTALTTDTWNNPGKTLPSDFYLPIQDGLYVGDEIRPYDLIAFQKSHLFRSTPRKWYIDHRQSKLYLTGTVSSSKTINLYYIYATADIATGTEPVWPDRFHPILAFKMAELWFAKDQTEPGRSWDAKWQKEYLELWNSMLQWDTRLKVIAHNSERDT